MATIVQLLQVEFDPTDTFYPLNLSRVQEIQSDIYGHCFTLPADYDSVEDLENAIEEELVSETGLMVRQFGYQLVDILV